MADPIGSWENDINWWSDPIRAEFWVCRQVTFVLCRSTLGCVKDFWVVLGGGGGVRAGVEGAGVLNLLVRGGPYLWAGVPQAPCLLVRMLTIFCFSWLAVTWSLCLVALMRWSHIFSSSLLSAAYWAQLD